MTRALSALDLSLAELLGAAGFSRAEPPLLIAADLVRDLVGEALARRLFLTSDAEGHELCLEARLHDPGGPGASGRPAGR